MEPWHGSFVSSISTLVTYRKVISAGQAVAAALLLYCGLSAFDAARAQSVAPRSAPVAILADGNAIVTGFSGMVQVPGPASNDPADLMFIDPNGPAARVVDLQAPGAPPHAQMLIAPKPFTLAAGQIGQVFGVALDDANPPNIYLAATSAYGLPIVVPAADGTLQRSRLGAAGAGFMPGLFGPAALQGGPGSIWRVDGATGQVSLFANVALDGVANSGPGLGGLAFDPASGTLYVADRATGMIHGFDRQGRERGRFDHGVQGRQAAGLNPVAFDPSRRLDITNPAFNSEDPSTWSYAPLPRRVFGLAVHGGRLYYSVAAGLQVWSVAIGADGSFASDPRVEVQAVPGNSGNEISKIAFDDRGRMLVAERAAPTGAYDFVVLAQQSAGLVLRLPAAPPSASNPGEYAIGFFDQLRDSTGGIAIGYNYTAAGRLDHAACGGFLWTTGDELRNSSDQAIATQLASGGPANVDGLQGNPIGLVRPANVPPLQSYFVDYDDNFATDANRGHIGDIAIRRGCQPAFAPPPPPLPSGLPPVEVVPPPGLIVVPGVPLPPGGFCSPGRVTNTRRCCPPDTRPLPNGACERSGCPPGQLTETGVCCPEGTKPQPNGRCEPTRCPPGQLTETGVCCPEGTKPQPNGRCEPTRCPPGQLTETGVCCPEGTKPQPNGRCEPTRCPPGQLTETGVCCPEGTKPQPNGRCLPPPPVCRRGETLQPNGRCEPPPPPSCPPRTPVLANGTCGTVEQPPTLVPVPVRPGRRGFKPHPPREQVPILRRPPPRPHPPRIPILRRPRPPHPPRVTIPRRPPPPHLTRVPTFRGPPPRPYPPAPRGRPRR